MVALNPESSYIPLGKKTATYDDTISVRIDREGLDPSIKRQAQQGEHSATRAIGTLSFDFGSVLGEESNIGVKIARFLSYAEAARGINTPDGPTLNHSPYYFPVGDSEKFEEILNRERSNLDRSAATISTLKH